MKKHYTELDILRGLAIIGVILIHISSTAIDLSLKGSFSEVFAILINQTARFAVPVFLFLSGLGLTISNRFEEKYFIFLWKRISKIIVLYIIWSVIYFVITEQGSLNIIEFVKGFIVGSTYYHLYYVPLIIIFYISYPILRRIGKTNVGLILITLITIFSQVADRLLNINILNDPRNVLNWAIYFVFGIWFSNNFDKKIETIKNYRKIIIPLFALTLIGVFLEAYLLINEIGKANATTSMRPSIILFTILFIAVILCTKWKNKMVNVIYLKLAEMSYGIYLSHALILTIYIVFYSKLGDSNGPFVFFLTSFLIVTSLSVVVTYAMDKLLSKLGFLLKA